MSTNDDATDSHIGMRMMAYPTTNPTWQGSIYDDVSKKELLTASLSFDYGNPYSGDIHETLTRPDLWEQVRVSLEEEVSDPVRGTMVALLNEQLAVNVRDVLAKAEQFYPQLACRAEAEALVASGRSYEAFVKIAEEVPPDDGKRTEEE